MIAYLSGTEAIIPSFFAVIYYGIFTGGFVILGLLGAGAARILALWQIRHEFQLGGHIFAGIIIALAWAGTFSILDKIIGHW